MEESRINKMNIRKVENLLEALEPHPTKLLMTGDPSDRGRLLDCNDGSYSRRIADSGIRM